MKYFATMLAVLMLTAPAFAQRSHKPSKRPQARVEAQEGCKVEAEVKALRKELEALKKQVAGMRKRMAEAKKGEGKKAEGRKRRGRGSRGDSGARGKRGHKKEEKVTPKKPDWDAIRKRMEEYRKDRGVLHEGNGRWQRGRWTK